MVCSDTCEGAACCAQESGIPSGELASRIVKHLTHAAAKIRRINSVRHGQATSIRTTLSQAGDKPRMEIADNGAGFKEPPPESGGLGLRIMRYRCELLGLGMNISPAHGGGTLLCVA